jgi:hypothetical protein
MLITASSESFSKSLPPIMYYPPILTPLTSKNFTSSHLRSKAKMYQKYCETVCLCENLTKTTPAHPTTSKSSLSISTTWNK